MGCRWHTLNSGGWNTATTKLRMNQAAAQFSLGFHVRQRDGTWYVITTNGKEFVFYDGMEFMQQEQADREDN